MTGKAATPQTVPIPTSDGASNDIALAIIKMRNELKTHEREAERLTKENSVLKADLAARSRLVEKVESEGKKLKEKLDKSEIDVNFLQKEIAMGKVEKKKLELIIAELHKQVEKLQVELSNPVIKVVQDIKLKEQVASLKGEVKVAKAEIVVLQDRVKGLEYSVRDKEKMLLAANAQLELTANMAGKIRDMENLVSFYKHKLEDAQAEIKLLQGETNRQALLGAIVQKNLDEVKQFKEGYLKAISALHVFDPCLNEYRAGGAHTFTIRGPRTGHSSGTLTPERATGMGTAAKALSSSIAGAAATPATAGSGPPKGETAASAAASAAAAAQRVAAAFAVEGSVEETEASGSSSSSRNPSSGGSVVTASGLVRQPSGPMPASYTKLVQSLKPIRTSLGGTPASAAASTSQPGSPRVTQEALASPRMSSRPPVAPSKVEGPHHSILKKAASLGGGYAKAHAQAALRRSLPGLAQETSGTFKPETVHEYEAPASPRLCSAKLRLKLSGAGSGSSSSSSRPRSSCAGMDPSGSVRRSEGGRSSPGPCCSPRMNGGLLRAPGSLDVSRNSSSRSLALTAPVQQLSASSVRSSGAGLHSASDGGCAAPGAAGHLVARQDSSKTSSKLFACVVEPKVMDIGHRISGETGLGPLA